MAAVLNGKLAAVLIKNVSVINLATTADTSSAVLVIVFNLEM
jgi:hypothetical protein